MILNRNVCKRGYDLFIGDIEFKLISGSDMEYYKLPKDKQWLDNPYLIGGRDVDISQISYSLNHRVRELFPINRVPVEVEKQLETLSNICIDCEREIQRTIKIVSDFVK